MTDGPESLTDREREILALVATGVTNQRIARDVGISVNTVKAHLRSIFAKLGVESRTEATTLAIQMGLINVMPGRPRAPSGGLAGPSGGLAGPSGGLRGSSGGLPGPSDILAGPSDAMADATAPGALAGRIRVAWRVGTWQLATLVATMVLALAAALWGGPRLARSGAVNRFVDLPASTSAEASESPAGRWTQRAALTRPRARFAQAALDGAIYAVSGVTEEGWTASVERYDVAADRWEPRADKPTPVANVGAAAVAGRIFVPGGYDEAGRASSVLEVYDPAEDSWSAAAPLPMGLYAYAIAPTGEGFYLFGGYDGKAYLDTVYYYDAAADAWQSVGRLTGPRAFAAAATVGDAIYLVGGTDGEQDLALCESYDPTEAAAGGNAWRAHAAMGSARSGHGLVAAGWDGTLLVNERYDLAHDGWSTFESPHVGEWRTLGLSAVAAADGTRLYAVGGWSGRPLNGVEVYQAEYRLYVP